MTTTGDDWRARGVPMPSADHKPATNPRGKRAKPSKRHKYGASPKAERTYRGIVFDSKKEMEVYVKLKALEQAGQIANLIRQPVFKWRNEHVARSFTGEEIRFIGRAERYTADFQYTENGATVTVDAKGYRTREYLKKKKIVEELFGIKITEL